MRIAYDQEAFYLQDYGGITRYIVRLVKELSRLGDDIKIIAPIHRNKYVSELPNSLFSGTYINWRPGKHSGSLARYNRYLARKRMGRWKPDIVHESYYSDSGVAPRDSRTVVTVYDMIYEIEPEWGLESELVTKDKRKSVERADHIICISKETRNELIKKFGIAESKTTVIYLGVDTEIPAGGVFLEDSSSRPFLLYVGQRGRYKNFSALLKAVSSSEKLKKDFDICAFGGGKFTNVEGKLIRDLGYTKDQVVQISGDDKVLRKLYQQAKAFVFPSLLEGFGLPPLESMAHSCPVISSNASVMPEILGSAAAYFDPTNIWEIKSVIEGVVYSKPTQMTLIENGRERIQNFTWSKCAELTREVYRKVLREKN